MQTKPMSNKWKFLFQWTLVITFGMALVMPTVTILSYLLTLQIQVVLFLIFRKLATLLHVIPIEADNTSLIIQTVQISQIPLNILLVAVPSFLFGVFQWLVLRAYIVNAKRWIWVSFIGIGVGVSIVIGGNYLISDWKASEISLELMGGVIIGTTLGISQWLILRQYVNYSSFWVLANILGISIGMVWGYPYFSVSGADGIGIVYYFAVFVFRLMIMHSAITGTLLAWLLNQPLKKLQTIAA